MFFFALFERVSNDHGAAVEQAGRSSESLKSRTIESLRPLDQLQEHHLRCSFSDRDLQLRSSQWGRLGESLNLFNGSESNEAPLHATAVAHSLATRLSLRRSPWTS